MLVKGSADYKKAQKLAEVIEGAAQCTKRNREYFDVEFGVSRKTQLHPSPLMHIIS